MVQNSNHRVLMVVTSFGKWGEISGVAYTHNILINKFIENNIPVDIVTYGPEDDYELRGSARIITHKPRLPLRVDIRLTVDLSFEIPFLTRTISSSSYTIIHNADPGNLGFMTGQIRRKYKIPMASMYHTALDDHARSRLAKILGEGIGKVGGELAKHVSHLYYNNADLLLAPSEYTKNFLSEEYKPKAVVLGRGIDTCDFNRSKRKRSSQKTQVLYVGRIAPEKNLDVLVDIFADRQDVDLKIVGDGPYMDSLKRKLPHAIFTGAIFEDDLFQAFADADIFAFPSESETFGNVILQAMSSSLPVVVMDKMASPEQVDQGKNGFICKNTEEFAKALDKLIADKKLRQSMGRAGRKHAEKKTWDSIFDNLLSYYDEAISIYTSRKSKPTGLQVPALKDLFK